MIKIFLIMTILFIAFYRVMLETHFVSIPSMYEDRSRKKLAINIIREYVV